VLPTHGLRPFGRLRASCGLHSCAASAAVVQQLSARPRRLLAVGQHPYQALLSAGRGILPRQNRSLMPRRDWTRGELIIAFNLYGKIPFGRRPRLPATAHLSCFQPTLIRAQSSPLLAKGARNWATAPSLNRTAVWNSYLSRWWRRHVWGPLDRLGAGSSARKSAGFRMTGRLRGENNRQTNKSSFARLDGRGARPHVSSCATP